MWSQTFFFKVFRLSEIEFTETMLHYLLLDYGPKTNILFDPLELINPDIDIYEGTSLLHYAFLKGYIEIADELLKAGANINILDCDGYTPLMRTCLTSDKSFLTIATQILFRGADMNLQHPKSGATALMVAVSYKNAEIVKLLLEHDANPNIMSNRKKNTPLHKACLNGDISIVTLLVEHAKTNVNLPNAKGETPLAIAMKNDRPKLVAILKKYGGSL